MIRVEIDEVVEFLQVMWSNKVDLFSCDVRNNYALNYYDALAINEIPLLIRDLKEFKQYYESHNDELMFVELDCLKRCFTIFAIITHLPLVVMILIVRY